MNKDLVSKHDIWRIIKDHAYWVQYNGTSHELGMTLTGINQALNECPVHTGSADNNAQEAIDALDRIWNYCEEIDYSLPDNEKTGYKMLPDVTIIRNYLRSSITGEENVR